ncbi:MAG: hypothetical protein D3913_12090 [Candidatus Electrothrix sp. LOE1_4_5]|nr:hypothetical protein [Candidatus Electrothrix sp. AX1]MCI5118667.1 hypothetical protein [Candidatus Electrothrix gigas]MCI5182873.1 hypothetical protein [Candidatus Electrothrix gigas]
MNIRFEYLYRDAGNNKIYNDIVVANKKGTETEVLKRRIRNVLISGEFFIAKKSSLPKLQFPKYDEEFDHDWYEFSSLEDTDCVENDILHRDIAELINNLEMASRI